MNLLKTVGNLTGSNHTTVICKFSPNAIPSSLSVCQTETFLKKNGTGMNFIVSQFSEKK